MEQNHVFPKNIFLADDDLDDCDFFSEAITEINDRVTVKMLHDGKALLTELQKSPEIYPDLIFLDLNMPIMDGAECLSAIRNNQLYAKSPVIMMSTSKADSDVDMVFKLGANRFITKPNNFNDLKAVIEKIMKTDWVRHFSLPSKENFVLTP